MTEEQLDFEQGEIGPTCSALPATWDWKAWCPSIVIRGGRQKHWIKVKNRQHAGSQFIVNK
jgi:hypothetical protein